MAAVGVPLPTSRPPMAGSGGERSRLSMMQARLREQLMVEKESRLLEMAARQEAAREGTIQRVTRSSASSLSSSLSSLNSSGAGQGRVRKMFEERRNNGGYAHSPVGWDKSYPLDPVGKNNQGYGQHKNTAPQRGKMKGVIRDRGVSVDRAKPNQGMTRSRSQVTMHRNQREDSRTQGRNSIKPPQPRHAQHHKSTSSLLDTNQNYTRRKSTSSGSYSRDPSPAHTPGYGYRAAPKGPSPAPPASRNNRMPLSPKRSVSNPPRRNSNVSRYSPDDEVDYNSQRPPGYDHKRVEEWARSDNRRLSDIQQSNERLPPSRRASMDLLSPQNDQENIPSKNRLSPKPPKSKGPSRTPTPGGMRSQTTTPVPSAKPLLKPKPANTVKSTPVATPRQASTPNPNLASCSVCGRNFAKDRIEKHVSICAKSKAKEKKRKVFDPVKMRNQGTESESYVAKGSHLKDTKPKKKADWRKKHEDFINTVRAAKGIKGYERTPMDTSDYVECPHCGRKFSEGAADRHIPKCASIVSNKGGGGKAASKPNSLGRQGRRR